jgi:TRAP transporter TAXI family solute receptor
MAPKEQNGRPASNARSRRTGLRARLAIVAATIVLAGVAAWRLWFSGPLEPVTLTVGSGPFGSDSFALMREVADVVERHSSTLRIAVRPTRDSSESISLLNRGDIDLAAIRADSPVEADVRLVALLFQDYFQFLVNDGLKAYDVPDIAGLRIAVPQYGTDAIRSFFAIADHYDLPVDKIRWIPVSFAEARRGLMAGRYDGIFTVRSLRDPELVRLFDDAQLKRKGLRYLPVRQAAAIALKRPFLGSGIIPQGAFNGIAAVPAFDTPTSTIDRILVSRASVPNAAIRELTSILFDHRLDIAIRFPLAAQMRQPDSDSGMTVALHEGAAAYYNREKPGFLESNAEPLGLGLTLLAMLGSMLAAMRSYFTSSQKNRADRYNHQLLDIDRRIEDAGNAAALNDLRREHTAVLHAVVVALDTDEIAEEGFQSFALLWQSVRDRIGERQALLDPSFRHGNDAPRS